MGGKREQPQGGRRPEGDGRKDGGRNEARGKGEGRSRMREWVGGRREGEDEGKIGGEWEEGAAIE